MGTDSSRRVERAWAYDTEGNVVDTWQGDLAPTGPDAVDRWQYAFDNPTLPTVSFVTDPLGDVATYTLGRDSNSRKPKLIQLDGDCPRLYRRANSILEYNDPAHPLLATRETDAVGNLRLYTYDGNGMLTSMTEAAGTAVERITEWDYHTTYPALVTQLREPSVAGGSNQKITTYTYDANGNLTRLREQGFEAGQPLPARHRHGLQQCRSATDGRSAGARPVERHQLHL